MNYRDKLTLTSSIGIVTSGIGALLNNPSVFAGGFGLLASSYYALDDIETNQDEFADLREELHKREKLYNKLWKK